MRIVPRHEVERRWAEHHRERIEKSRRKHENRVKNLGLVLRLDDGRKLEFRGRHYGVPPIPWPLALRITEVQQRLEDFITQTREHQKNPERNPLPAVSDWAAVYRDTAILFKKLCRPEGRIRRLLWPITPSPINNAPPTEVGMALGFFSRCLGLDGAETLMAHGVAPTSTSPSKPAASSPASPRGARTANRARGRRS